MLNILYAASNNKGAKIQLSRFMEVMKDKPYNIKIAAYIKSSPKNLNIDWTLDSLLNIYKPEHLSLENDNFRIYFEQVKYFEPDLIISDLEYFTSYIANTLNITLWQYSAAIINFALAEKYDLGLFKRYSYSLNKNPVHTQRLINIIDNSNCNFVCSHLGDMEKAPKLKDNFEWVRPYYRLGKTSLPCHHHIMGTILRNNIKIMSLFNNYTDCVVFTDFYQESNDNCLIKDIEDTTEYACNLYNSDLFICEGQTNFLADAFYNNKHPVILPDFNDPECIINSVLTEHFKLGSNIYNSTDNLTEFMYREVTYSHNEDIQFLHERIESL